MVEQAETVERTELNKAIKALRIVQQMYFRDLKVSFEVTPTGGQWHGLEAMLVVLGNKKRDWNSCKRQLVQADLIEKLAGVSDELAKSLVDELRPMMEQNKKFMDPVRMAVVHGGAGALCTYLIAFYNLGLALKGQPAYSTMTNDQATVVTKPVESVTVWEEIKLTQLFDKCRDANRDERRYVAVHDTTGNVATALGYNSHSNLLEFNKNIMRCHAKKETKKEAFEALRKSAIYAMKNGTNCCIKTDVFPADFAGEWTDEETFPSAKIFDFEYWRKDKNYMQIVRIEDETDTCGKPCGYFPWNENFGMVILTTISNPHDLITFGKNIPHWDSFKKFKVVENDE